MALEVALKHVFSCLLFLISLLVSQSVAAAVKCVSCLLTHVAHTALLSVFNAFLWLRLVVVGVEVDQSHTL